MSSPLSYNNGIKVHIYMTTCPYALSGERRRARRAQDRIVIWERSPSPPSGCAPFNGEKETELCALSSRTTQVGPPVPQDVRDRQEGKVAPQDLGNGKPKKMRTTTMWQYPSSRDPKLQQRHIDSLREEKRKRSEAERELIESMHREALKKFEET